MNAAPLVALATTPGFYARLQRLWDEGAAVLPFPPDLPALARAALLEKMRPGAIQLDDDRRVLATGRAVALGTAAVLLTSGTTGAPKGVCLSHRALSAAARASSERIGASDAPWLACLPLHHIAGFGILVRSFVAGSSPEIHLRFDPEALAASEARFVSLVPTMLERLLAAKVDLARFDAILVGGANIPPSLVERARSSGANVIRSYGMTETSGGVVYDGVPLTEVKVRIEGDDRIALASPSLMDGYRDGGEGVRDGWFVTSDLGALRDGRLEVFGRADDVIVTGGEKASPGLVESFLLRHPSLVEACVVGVPDRVWGERVVACIVATKQLTEQQIRDHLAPLVDGPHLIPKQVLFQAAIPLTPEGKRDLAAVRRLATH